MTIEEKVVAALIAVAVSTYGSLALITLLA